MSNDVLHRLVVLLLTGALALPGAVASPKEAAIFARVGDTVITMEELEAAFRLGVRQRFYHGRVPEERLAAYRKEVGQQLIDRVLLLQEARRRGVEPDEAWVSQQLQRYLERYRRNGAWRGREEALEAGLRQMLEEQSLLARLEATIRDVGPISEAEVRAYYEAHPEKFTTPAAQRVSMILLKVDPASPAQAWAAAEAEARDLRRRLARGADFATLARIHSADASAARGGDLGWQHEGMLAPAAEAILAELEPGQVSEPVALLQGVALLRLEARRPPQLNSFEQVRERAEKLLRRERAEAAWTAFLADLRRRSQVVMVQPVE